MTEQHLQLLIAEFDRLDAECDTPEKALKQLQSEGLLDSEGRSRQERDALQAAAA